MKSFMIESQGEIMLVFMSIHPTLTVLPHHSSSHSSCEANTVFFFSKKLGEWGEISMGWGLKCNHAVECEFNVLIYVLTISRFLLVALSNKSV